MRLPNRVLPALCLSILHIAATPPGGQGGPLYEACGQDPYLKGKHGFSTLVQAKDHAYREFQREVRAGRLDPSREEFFTYLYSLRLPEGRGPVYLHSPWRQAAFEKVEHGSRRHLIRRPYAETENLQVDSMMHSHPTGSREGSGPSRVDVATASRYRNPDGSFRYLYLINNHGRLIQFKARREIDPGNGAALATMPVRPRVMVDWID